MLPQETAELAQERLPETADPLAARAAHNAIARTGLAAHVAQTVIQRASALDGAKPAAYVSAAALARLADERLGGIGSVLNARPGRGLVPVYLAAPASPELLRCVRAYALAYLAEERDQPELCADAAHHQAVCGLFAALEREERRVA